MIQPFNMGRGTKSDREGVGLRMELGVEVQHMVLAGIIVGIDLVTGSMATASMGNTWTRWSKCSDTAVVER
jgi:hypothetical protein